MHWASDQAGEPYGRGAMISPDETKATDWAGSLPASAAPLKTLQNAPSGWDGEPGMDSLPGPWNAHAMVSPAKSIRSAVTLTDFTNIVSPGPRGEAFQDRTSLTAHSTETIRSYTEKIPRWESRGNGSGIAHTCQGNRITRESHSLPQGSFLGDLFVLPGCPERR